MASVSIRASGQPAARPSGRSAAAPAAPLSTLATVFEAIREVGVVSRVELVGSTGFTAATITHAVRELIAAGFVRESGTAQSRGGSPRRLLEIDPEALYTVGVQFDRYTATSVVVDLAGRVVARAPIPGAGGNGPEVVLPRIAQHVVDLLDSCGVPRERVLGVGLATYGSQDRERGMLLTPQPTPAWHSYPTVDGLEALLGIPVHLENDATAASMGDQGVGGRGSHATVYMAGGIGGGVVLGGRPYRGASSNGVELGHLSVDLQGRQCSCGNRGCVDNVAGPRAVVDAVVRDAALAAALGIGGDTDGDGEVVADFERVALAAVAGDESCAAVLHESAQGVAAAVISLVNLFDVSRVVLSGAAFVTAGPLYADVVRSELASRAFMREAHPVSVEVSEHPADAAAEGAAVLVLRSLFETRVRTSVRLSGERRVAGAGAEADAVTA